MNTSAFSPRGRDSGLPHTLDASFHLLDRQIVDPHDHLVAKVDDLELQERFDGLAISAVLTGPGALGPRLGGRLGEWVVAIWRRLHPDVDPRPGRIPVDDITGVDSAVHVRRSRAQLGVDGFERWVDATIVSRLPLVHGKGPADEAEAPDADPSQMVRELMASVGASGGDGRRLSHLLGRRVIAADGRRLGNVSDVRLRLDPVTGTLVVADLIVNSNAVRSRFGYERPNSSQPWAIRLLLRLAGSPAAGLVPWSDVEGIDWDQRTVRCRGGALRTLDG